MINWLKDKSTEVTAWIALLLFVLVVITRGDTIPVWVLITLFFIKESWLQEQVDRMAPKIGEWLDQLKQGEQQ